MRHVRIDPVVGPGEERAPCAERPCVRDRMSPRVVTVRASAPLGDALRLMAEHRVDELPVVDDRAALVGMVSADDARGTGRVPRSPADAVATVVREPVASIAPAVPLREAARRMAEGGIEAFPVVEEGRVIGILSRSDVGLGPLPASGGRR